jgi:hypothetical protein
MVAEVYAGFSAFKVMFDMAKGLKDINDAAIRNGAVIELQEQILSAQSAQAALVERVGELEKEVAGFKEWDAEKKRYQLTEVGPRVFTYVMKPEASGTEPSHWICASCYQNGKKSVLQGSESAMSGWMHTCLACDLEIRTGFDKC